MSQAPDLSVVIPVRDDAATLGAAIDSVLTGADGLLEVIVVDDGSRDDACARVATDRGEPVRLVRQPGRGPAAARNAGVRAARGELVGFLDADDIWLARVPDPRRPLLEAHPGAIAYGAVEVVDGDRRSVGPLPVHGSSLMARATYEGLGGLDERLVSGEDDVEWFLRARDTGVPVLHTAEIVLRYIRRPGSLTPDPNTGLLRGLHATIRRRRAA